MFFSHLSVVHCSFAHHSFAQATYFIQIVFVGTVVMISMELLRVKPLILALIRRCLPPNLNEKERQTTVFGIRPLADPADFEGPDNLAQIVSMTTRFYRRQSDVWVAEQYTDVLTPFLLVSLAGFEFHCDARLCGHCTAHDLYPSLLLHGSLSFVSTQLCFHLPGEP